MVGQRTERRQYRNPPISEALCEIQVRDATWTFGSPAELYRRLEHDYPVEPAQQPAIALPAGLPPLGFGVSLQESRIRFANDDGTRHLIVGPNSISAHLVGAYPGWEAFHEAISSALSDYFEVTRATQVARVGVRYLNQIVIPEASIELSDYFAEPPGGPPGMELPVTTFLSRTEARLPKPNMLLVSTFGSIAGEAGTSSVMLDLDAIWQADPDGPALAPSQLDDVICELRDFERDAFEANITERLRGQFDGQG